MSGGFVLPALALGLGSISLAPTRGFFPLTGGQAIQAQVTVDETHHDDLQITDHPVGQGAPMSDHAFKRQPEVTIRCGFSNSPSGNPGGLLGAAISEVATLGGSAVRTAIGTALTVQSLLSGNAPKQVKDVYADFIAAQENLVLFTVSTGKRLYVNMLLKSITVTTNQSFENSLDITILCKQIKIVSTRVVTLPINATATSDAAKYTPVQDFGQGQLKTASNFIGP